MALLGAVFFGFVPMFLLAAFINWLDRYEKEPKLLLGAAFVWGVVIAGGGAYILNTVSALPLRSDRPGKHGRIRDNLLRSANHRRRIEGTCRARGLSDVPERV
jgi:hypothetical protein